MFRVFPLLLISVLFYNLIALGGGAILHHDVQDMLSYNHALAITMFSGDQWKFSFGDFLILADIYASPRDVIEKAKQAVRN